MFKLNDTHLEAKLTKEDIEPMKKNKLYLLDAIINNKAKWNYQEIDGVIVRCGGQAFLEVQRTQDTRPLKKVECWSSIPPDMILVTR